MAKTKSRSTALAKSEASNESIARTVQSTPEAPLGLLDYLAECSETLLDSFELNRLGRAANSGTKLRAILEDLVQAHAEARFASWRRQYIQGHGDGVPAPTVRAEVPEISIGNADIMQPWFGTRKQSGAIRRAQSRADRQKWSAYFYMFGCLVCGSTTVPHFSNGMCDVCHQRTANRLTAIVREPRREQGS